MSAASKYAPQPQHREAKAPTASSKASRWASPDPADPPAQPEPQAELEPELELKPEAEAEAEAEAKSEAEPVSGVKIVSEAEAAALASAAPQDVAWPPHPYLTQPLLYISHLPNGITKRDLARDTFSHTLPVKFDFDPAQSAQPTSGIVHFSQLANAELAYATVESPLLTITPLGTGAEPEAQAKRRLLKQLPASTTPSDLFRLLRPYGPLRKVTLITSNPRTGQVTGFKGMATAEFYSENDAQLAERALHCSDLEGNTISVSVDTLSRATPVHDIRASAPVFVPRVNVHPYQAMPTSPQHFVYNNPPTPVIDDQAHFASPSPTAKKFIDPCNLFVKSLASHISSNDLYQAFQSFGDIVSARVMRDDQGNSRQFGFVSFKRPDQASLALRHMHRKKLEGSQISVSLHEPKMLRQEKLAAKFASQGQPSSPGQSHSGRLSPAATSVSAGASSRRMSLNSNSGSVVDSISGNELPKRTPKLQRKGSHSYFRAAMEADMKGESYSVHQLSSLSSNVRNEVLAGLLARRLRKLPGFDQVAVEEGILDETEEQTLLRRQALLAKASGQDSNQEGINWTDQEVQMIVEEMVAKLSISEAVDALENPEALLEHALHHGHHVSGSSLIERQPLSSFSTTPSFRTYSTDSVPDTTAATSADVSQSVDEGNNKERTKLLHAVNSLSLPPSTRIQEIVDLLLGLPKKERALCIFNSDLLAHKVEEAREILELSDEDEEPAQPIPTQPAPVTVSAATPAPALDVPKTEEKNDLKTLASLPATELVSQLQAGVLSPTIEPASQESWDTTEKFVSTLSGLTLSDAKQKLGDRIFKIIKSGGIKGAPKLTIALLDSEDLRSLAHLADSFPEALREKALRLKEP